ncbi:hypothetical protein Tco_0155636 [Tanacetum coccineum]
MTLHKGKTGTEYLLEQSFSVDNLFVFVLIFKYFKAPLAYQNRAFIQHRWCSNLSLVIDSSWNCNPSGISREILLSKNEQHEQAYLCCRSGQKFAAAADEHLVQFLAMPEEEGHTIHKGCRLILVLMYQVNELQSRELKRLDCYAIIEHVKL